MSKNIIFLNVKNGVFEINCYQRHLLLINLFTSISVKTATATAAATTVKWPTTEPPAATCLSLKMFIHVLY